MPLPKLPNDGSSLPKIDKSTNKGLPKMEDYNSFSNLPPIEEPLEQKEVPRENVTNMEDEIFFEQKTEEDIDVKNKKVLPLGKNKSKKVRAGDVDNRKNLARTALLIRWAAAIFVVILLGLGIKNTYFPEQIYTPAEIDAIVKTSMGQTGFPLEQGKQLVQSFTKELLTTSNTPANNKRLNRFLLGYNTDNAEMADLPYLQVRTGSNQKVIGEPVVYEYDTLLPYAGRYKVTAMVSDDNGDFEKTTNTTEDTTHWISLAMNVYYNKDDLSLSIIPDTIALLPSYKIGNSADIPSSAKIGTGELAEDMTEVLRPTINGFFKAYANVTFDNREEIVQYVAKDADAQVYQGFGGAVQLNGDPLSSVNYIVYKGANNDEYKVSAKVTWTDAKASNKTVIYQSHYILTINLREESYLVTKIVPFTYIREEKID